MLADSAACRAEHTERMCLVDHEHRVMTRLDLDEARQVGDVTVGAVDSLDHHERAAVLAAHAGEHRVERLPVVVREDEPPRTRELRALHRAVVHQRIAEHHVFRPEQMRDRRDVGRVPADVDDRVRDSDELRDLPLQVAVHRPLARHDTTGRHRAPPPLERRLRRSRHVAVAREAEVVVVGEVHEGAPGDRRVAAGHSLVHVKERARDLVAAQLLEPSLEGRELLPAAHVRRARVRRPIRGALREHRGHRLGPIVRTEAGKMGREATEIRLRP